MTGPLRTLPSFAPAGLLGLPLGLLLSACALLSACTVDDEHPTARRCDDTTTFCPSGQSCYRGFCVVDGGGMDSGTRDAGDRDANTPDTGPADAEMPDTGPTDSGPPPDGGPCDPACTGGEVCCGGVCVDAMTDQMNCGVCGRTCAGSNPACCAGSCVDFADDESNCGRCGNTCSGDGILCCGGTCTNTNTEEAHCGRCFNMCTIPTLACCDGTCRVGC